MHISFCPVARFDPLRLERSGDTLIVNGQALDFGPLPEGARLPADAVDCDWIVGSVERIAGVLHLTVVLPYGLGNAPPAPPVTVTQDGPIALPVTLPAPEDAA